MKKTLLLLLLIIPMLAMSCSSDDNVNTSLDGTSWGSNDVEERKITFKKKEFEYKFKKDDVTQETVGTYVYNPPFISLTYIEMPSGTIKTIKGTVQDNTMKIGEIIFVKE